MAIAKKRKRKTTFLPVCTNRRRQIKAKRSAKSKNGRKKNKVLKIKAPKWNPMSFKELGRGGEAVIYFLKPDTVAKIFLKPDASEFSDNPELKEAAKIRITEMQTKLFEFPVDLPDELVTPIGVLISKDDNIFGYVMPFIKGVSLDKLSRTNSPLKPKRLKKILLSLYDTVASLHAQGVIIGDFNENNIIVASDIPYLVDADSMQFGPYQCRSFIPRFTAPEIMKVIKTQVTEPVATTRKKKKDKEAPLWSFLMAKPHSELTDWYSFLVIAMRLLTFTDPYGGVVKDVSLPERIKQKITVFNPQVIYPPIARPLRDIPRPILEVFFKVFHKDERFVPEREIFESLNDE